MPWILRMLLFIVPAILLLHAVSFLRMRGAARRLWGPQSAMARVLKWLYLWWLALPVVLLLLYLLGLKDAQRTLFYGHAFWDWLVVYPFWFGLIFSVEFLPIILIFEAVWFGIKRIARRFHRMDRVKAASLLGMSLGLMLYVATTVVVDTQNQIIQQQTVDLADWPASLDGFRIVHISDVQGDNRTGPHRMQRYVDAINALEPDLLLFTGDLITRGREHVPVAASVLGKTRARYGRLACMGDHDFWTDPVLVRRELEKNGFLFLEDTTIVLPLGEASLHITGITEIYRKRTDVASLQKLATNGIGSPVRILMLHQPTEALVRAAPALGYNLIAAGHTHGGQVVLWNWLWPLTPGRWENGFWRGFHWLDGALLSINSGLGLTFAPVRYQAPANIHVIELRSMASTP
ncbi:MAG: metallophosphoesterase [candidate division KSB1 bacterium]|nr:metallophosphoesterase [candidate division KSB1 bacterium]